MTNAQHFPISVMFTSRNTAKTIAFYRDTLGFKLEASWPDEKQPMWANLMLDGQSVMIGGQMSPDAVGEMCGNDPGAKKYMETLAKEFETNRPGVGVVTYLMVPDVDKFHAGLVKKGVKDLAPPRSQFYGIRDFGVQDPDGYRLLFYSPIKLSECQSCGMPLTDAKEGQMYCQYCTDSSGKLRPYEAVLEGTITGCFMGMQKMARPEAEKAAKAHLKKMPAWAGR